MTGSSKPAAEPCARDATRGADDALPPPHIAALLTDAHCHPTDDPQLRSSSTTIPHIVDALHAHPLKNVCIMASNVDDQHLVRQVASSSSSSSSSTASNIIPAFGHHPWFVHRLSLVDPPLPKREHYISIFVGANEDDWSPNPQSAAAAVADAPEPPAELLELTEYLTEPVALSEVLKTLRADLEKFPHAMLGEVGLDRSFRLPSPPEARAVRAKAAAAAAATEAEDSGDPKAKGASSWRASKLAWTLSSFTTPLSHQLAVLQAQMCIAIDLRRSVSFHSVKAQGATADFFMHMTRIRPRGWGIGFSDINVDLHSCTISAPGIIQIQKTHQNIFVSFSTTINTRQKALHKQIRACDPRRLLSESDFNTALPHVERAWRPSSPRVGEGEVEGATQEDSAQSSASEAEPKEFPLARRTWAIVQWMAEALDVRHGLGPESGTQYGRRAKEQKRSKGKRGADAASSNAKGGADSESEEEEEDRNEGRGEEGDGTEVRQEALARLLAANWTRFHHVRERPSDSAAPSRRGSAPTTTTDGDASSPGAAGAQRTNGSGSGSLNSKQEDEATDSDSDSDDEWNPAARAAVLRERQQQQQ
ncbi:hypothetical protein V8E36_000756 [Tilletia maclaganii]